MKKRVQSSELPHSQGHATPISKEHKAAILRETGNILKSHAFKTSKRSQEFLAYVVEHTLEGHLELLKERSIGVSLFQRPADYATGEDGVVRVQAGEVRKKLAQYHQEQGDSSPLRIELPVGSYVPEFNWHQHAPSVVLPTPQRSENPRKLRLATTIALGLALALALVLVSLRVHYGKAQGSPLDKFWSPIFGTAQAVLICIPKPMVYRPSWDLYQKFSKAHSQGLPSAAERLNKGPSLNPNDVLRWGEMLQAPEFGLATGDVYVATRLSALFARINKPSQLRIGNDYSFEDLRNSAAVLVGSFDNRWTVRMTSDLRFVFAEDNNGGLWLEERGPSRRIWSRNFGPQNAVAEDFGVVTRLLNAKTGQVLVTAAGLGMEGTQAAGEFISTENVLTEALRTAPSDWEKKNLQVVVETTVTDSVPGPPRVVAIYFW